MSAIGRLTLTYIFCYHRVFAFDIDVNNTISNLTVEGVIQPMAGDVYAGNIMATMC